MQLLVVEDHEDTRFVLVMLLRRWGHEVSEAGTVAEAVALLKEKMFDILVTDLGLPDGSGHQVLAQATRLGTAKKTIALTALNSSTPEGERSEGFDHYLTKPFDAARLKSLLASL